MSCNIFAWNKVATLDALHADQQGAKETGVELCSIEDNKKLPKAPCLIAEEDTLDNTEGPMTSLTYASKKIVHFPRKRNSLGEDLASILPDRGFSISGKVNFLHLAETVGVIEVINRRPRGDVEQSGVHDREDDDDQYSVGQYSVVSHSRSVGDHKVSATPANSLRSAVKSSKSISPTIKLGVNF